MKTKNDKIIMDDPCVINSNANFSLKGQHAIYIGKDSLVKVGLAVGVSSTKEITNEYKKLEKICNLSYRPDIINDLSIVKIPNPLYKFLINNFDGAIGIVPYYSLFSDKSGLDKQELLETIQRQLEEGVSFMTLHLTAEPKLYELACATKRHIPLTSRGGYCIIRDSYINKRQDNILIDNLNTILKMFKKYNVAISIGSVFRPATIWDAMDDIERKEIENQIKLVKLCKEFGVNVILEGLGHASLQKIDEYLETVSSVEVPLMPLGPLPSDELIGYDHIGNALGAFYMSKSPWLSIINAVTRKEHLGGIPSLKDSVEALKTARATAHIINCNKSQQYMDYMERSGYSRAELASCIVKGGLFDNKRVKKCARCGRECPYNINNF